MSKWKIVFCAGLGFCIFINGVHFSHAAGDGFGMMLIGSFLMLCAYAIGKIEKKDYEQDLKHEHESSCHGYNSFKEAREIRALKCTNARKGDDPVFKEAEICLGWKRKAKGDDDKIDWWLIVPYVECKCGNYFMLTGEDRSRLRFPVKPDPQRGAYIEVSCKNCKRRITVFRS